MRQTYRVLAGLIALGVVVQAAAIAFGWFTALSDVDNGLVYADYYFLQALLRYRDTAVLLTEMRNEQVGLAKKLALQATKIEPVELGLAGIWIEGGKHVLMWQFGPRNTQELRTRLAGNVLVWYDGERTFRLEGDLPKERILELARQIPHEGVNRPRVSCE